MPALWTIDRPAPGHALPATAVQRLIEVASAPPSASRLLQVVQAVVPVEHLSLVAFHHDTPELIEGSSQHTHDRDVVAECFAIYRRSYFRSDAALRVADRAATRPAGEVSVLHCRADELPVSGWRDDIYVRERLTERFTLLHAPAPGAVQAIHLYRDDRQGFFNPEEIDQLLALAPLLRQAHHAALQVGAVAADLTTQVSQAEGRLGKLATTLSPREKAVCARIACGVSLEGIAADLDVAPSTVSTLRKRSYLKLAAAGLPADRLRLSRWLA
jgi:DNA-binding CsgD family transcriptional regulator